MGQVYIAASIKDRALAREIAMALMAEGVAVGARWVFRTEEDESALPPAERHKVARDNIQDLGKASAVVFINTSVKSPGKNFELGWAHATRTPTVIYVSEGCMEDAVQSVFYSLFEHVYTLKELVNWVVNASQ